MTQPTNFSVQTSGPATPAAFAARADDSFKALLDGHSGASRPSYAQPNTFWNDTSLSGSSPAYIRRMFYDGTDDIELYRVNITDNRIEGLINYRNTAVAEDVASASTCDISTSKNWYVRITGTTAITSFGTTNKNQYRMVRFAAALTLTHNATSLILPTGTNITTAADDILWAVSDGSGNWRVLSYTRADGSALFSTSGGAPEMCQTVLSGPTDSNGVASFGGSTGSTTVTVSGTLLLTAAGGYSNTGTVDRYCQIVNPAFTGLSTNGTMYGYIEVASNGVGTTGSTTLAPIYQEGGSPSIVNGQHTYIIRERKMYVGNGTSATQVYRVFIGEFTVSGSVVTAIIWYALAGRYYSGWFSVANATTYNRAGNIGVDPTFVNVLVLYRQSSSYVPKMMNSIFWNGGDTFGAAFGPTDRNNIRVRTGSAGVSGATGDLAQTFGSNDGATLTSGQYLVIGRRNW